MARHCATCGTQQRNHLAPVPAVDGEVAVEREDLAAFVELAHADQASVGQRGGDVVVTLEKTLHRLDLVGQRHADADHTARQQRQRLGRIVTTAGEQEAGFGNHRLASQQRLAERCELFACPGVEAVVTAMQCHPGPGVEQNDAAHRRPKPSR